MEILDYYNISPDIIKEHLADVPFPPCKDPLSAVPTQIKTALTRTYNAKHKSSVKATKSKKAVAEEGGAKRFNALAEEEGDGEISDVEETEANEVKKPFLHRELRIYRRRIPKWKLKNLSQVQHKKQVNKEEKVKIPNL